MAAPVAVYPVLQTINACTKKPLSQEALEEALKVQSLLGAGLKHSRKNETHPLSRSLLISPDKKRSIFMMTRTKEEDQPLVSFNYSCKRVFSGVDLATGEQVAIGISKKGESEEIAWNNLPNEERMLEMFKGIPEIVQLYFVVRTAKKVYFVMKYYNQGDLFKNIDEFLLSPEDQYSLMKDYLTGLALMHKSRVIHRELKADNLLVHRERPGKVARGVIADLGFASRLDDEEARKKRSGSFSWVSPELAKACSPEEICHANQEPGDVFVLGEVFYFILTGMGFDFQIGLGPEALAKAAKMTDADVEKVLEELDPEFQELLGEMLKEDPAKRITAAKALEKIKAIRV